MAAQSGLSAEIGTPDLAIGVLAAERTAGGAIVALCLDGEHRALIEITWQPGTALRAKRIELTARVDVYPASVSLSTDYLSLGEPGAGMTLIQRETGAVEQFRPVEQPACLAPNGRALICATSLGLLVENVTPQPAAMPLIWNIRPMMLMEIDSPRSMIVVPGESANSFTIAIGAYGELALIDVDHFAPGLPQAAGRILGSDGLVYDPLILQRPAPLAGGPQCHVFAVDDGAAGLAALDISSASVLRCPLGPNAYGTVRRVVPRLDGRACIVTTAAGRTLRWTPGSAPAALEAPSGTILLWHGERFLVLEAGSGVLGEVPAAV